MRRVFQALITYPDAVVKISKLIGAQWNELSAEEKKPYEEAQEKAKIQVS